MGTQIWILTEIITKTLYFKFKGNFRNMTWEVCEILIFVCSRVRIQMWTLSFCLTIVTVFAEFPGVMSSLCALYKDRIILGAGTASDFSDFGPVLLLPIKIANNQN